MAVIPLGRVANATTLGFSARSVRCEQCGERYLYDVKREGSGEGWSLFSLDNEGARERALWRAREDLRRKLRGDDAVPCPTCGWYQRDSVALLRARSWRWLGRAAVVLLILCLGSLGLYRLAKKNRESLLLGAFGMGTVGIGLVAVRIARGKWYNPNAGDAERRKKAGRARAYHPADEARLQQDRDIQVAADRLRDAAGRQAVWAIVVGTLSAAALTAAGCLGYKGVVGFRDAAESPRWPTVPGKVFLSAADANRRTHWAEAAIRYSFTVEGRTYYAEDRRPGTRRDVEDTLRRYPVGKEVTVHYKPGDPRTATLEPGPQGIPVSRMNPAALLWLVVGTFLLVLAVVLTWQCCRWRRSLGKLALRETWRPRARPGPSMAG